MKAARAGGGGEGGRGYSPLLPIRNSSTRRGYLFGLQVGGTSGLVISHRKHWVSTK